MLRTMRDRGVQVVDVAKESEDAYSEHCRVADLDTSPLRDCVSYYNGEGEAEPGSGARPQRISPCPVSDGGSAR